MSLRDISEHIREMYDTSISATTLSNIIDRVIPEVEERQNRPVDDVYLIVWLADINYKVKCEVKINYLYI